MPIIADTHTHTLASGHAFSTIAENVRAAARNGLRFLCVTEHGPSMFDAPKESFFGNIYKVVPDWQEGVIVLKGIEANIVNYAGELDLKDSLLAHLDWVIASYHTVCCEPGTVEDHTRGWLAVAENPLVDVIGHSGDGRYPFEYEPVIEAFAKNGKIVEINAHSFACRPGSTENCREIALCCKKHGVRVVCSSDAHFHNRIGDVGPALEMLRGIGYPEELILNLDYDRFLAVVQEKAGRKFI